MAHLGANSWRLRHLENRPVLCLIVVSPTRHRANFGFWDPFRFRAKEETALPFRKTPKRSRSKTPKWSQSKTPQEEPGLIPDYQPSDKKVPIIYAVALKSAVGAATNRRGDSPTHRLQTYFVLAPFVWKDEMGEAKCIDSMGDGIRDGSWNELYSGEEIISTFPINGFAYIRPCNICKDPVVAGYEINGVRTLFFRPGENVDGCCENSHRDAQK